MGVVGTREAGSKTGIDAIYRRFVIVSEVLGPGETPGPALISWAFGAAPNILHLGVLVTTGPR